MRKERGKCTVCERIMVSHRGMCGACYKEWRKWYLPPNVTCDSCGKAYHNVATKKGLKHTFCSMRCAGIFRIGKQADLSPAVYEMRSCEICGEEFRALGMNIHAGGGKYCSTACNGKARSARARRAKMERISYWRDVEYWRKRKGWVPVARQMIAEAGNACSICSDRKNLVVHHIVDPNLTRDVKLLFSPNNCEVLCQSCHGIKHQHNGELVKNTKFCQFCNAEFRPLKPGQRTCSRSCGARTRYGKTL